MPTRKIDPAKLLALIANLVMLLGLLWISIPPHRRIELGMRVSNRLRRNTQRMALMVAEWAMAHELRGEHEAAQAGYDMAYRIMTGLHDRAVSWYDSGRSAL